MSKLLFALLLCGLSLHCCAQIGDSATFVVKRNGEWVIPHRATPGEQLTDIASNYFVSNALLQSTNGFKDDHKVKPGDVVYIPLVKDNYVTSKGLNVTDLHTLYYRTGERDNVEVISVLAGVPKAEVRKWNNLPGDNLAPDEVLFVGWYKMVAPQNAIYNPEIKPKAAADTTVKHSNAELEAEYIQQTNSGVDAITEKGPAVFFEKESKTGVFYAFHNNTPRGTIIKVVNPGNGKSVYVKVIGAMPQTKQYANSVIGISSAARVELGAEESKLWCELSYSYK
jgi:LysM repeat protein